jgi:uncharacterized RDD family membrane protein YckC
MDQSNPNLLQEFESTVDLIPVTPGLRFVNYLIDVIAFYAISIPVGILLGIGAASSGAFDNPDPSDAGSIQLVLMLLWILVVFGYYTLFEYFAKGRTLGKMATGTVVVREDGSAPTFKDAFLRTLCRFIPFEPFSALGSRPWHDSLTHTW